MKRPLVFAVIPVVLGMGSGYLTGQYGLYLAGIFILGCFLLLLKSGLEEASFKYILFLWLFALSLAWFVINEAQGSKLEGYLDKPVTLTGIIKEVKEYPNRQVLIVSVRQVEGISLREDTQLKLTGTVQGTFSYGQVIRVYGKPELVFANGNPGDFSYRDYLAVKKIYTQVRALGKVEVIGSTGNFLARLAVGLREKAQKLAKGAMGAAERSVFLGILYGDTTGMDPADKEVFGITGVLHAFAVSGSNVAFVLFFGLMVFSFLPRLIKFGFAGCLVLFYALLSGAEGPVVRATVMALVVLLGYALGKRGDGLNSLALAVLLMLAYNPRYLLDAGFQLSFAATWGLIEIVPRLAGNERPVNGNIKELILLPVAAQIATLPILAYYFMQISLVGIVANILVAWFLAIILEVGLVGICFGLVSPWLGTITLLPLGILIKFTTRLLQILAQVPGAAAWVTRPSMGLIFLYYLLLIAWLKPDFCRVVKEKASRVLRKVLPGVLRARHLMVYPILLLFLISMVSTGLVVHVSRDLEVNILDVGQGDSILINTPEGKHYLIDGGPRSSEFDAGKSLVIPYLLGRGIKDLDGVFLTHPHDDHAGGLIEVVRNIPVKNFYVAPMVPEEKPGMWEILQDALRKRRVTVTELKAGNQLSLGRGITLFVLSPGDIFTGTRSDSNNNSLVTSVNYGRRSVLLTGDIELEALAHLRDKVNGEFSVLKLPHHGSKYGIDEELFEGIRVEFAVISVGKNNFGQPAPEALKFWSEKGVPILRTDKDGLVTVKTDGEKIKLYTGREQVPYEVEEK